MSNGDATDVGGTGLARQVVYWRDVLHEGPVPAVGADELRELRAEFLGRGDPGDRDRAAAMLTERDEALAAAADGEYVLWFEADLYDQLQIVQILDRLAGLLVRPERITLICIGEYPGIARFGGLGQLTADQLRELPASGAAARLTPAALELGLRAWAAFRAPTPERLGEVAESRSGELRFLGESFDRLAREYPSTRDGLSLTERRVLAAVAAISRDGAGAVAGSAFVRAASREARPFLGDSTCFEIMDRLAAGPEPLLATEPAGDPVQRTTLLRLTGAGARVLAGELDHVAANGVDRWIGGVRLQGRDVAWRWDDGVEALIQT